MEGYSSDVEYTAHYYKELDPDFLNICAVMAGVTPIETSEPFSYCELGCGHGLTVLTLATRYPNGTFYAVDYNPSHIAQARAIAKEIGLENIQFFEKSFQEMVEDDSLLPEVDFMVFHGVYTWVNDENRANIVTLCQRHVISGGLVYNSYNAKSGWLYSEPIQKLIWGLSKEFTGSSIEKMKKITQTLESLQEIDSGYFKSNSAEIKKRIDKIKTSNSNYIVHEYLHDSWKAFYFPEVCEDMERAKLTYLCIANPAEVYSDALLPTSLQERLKDINEHKNRELLRDLTLNRTFRRDIYSRGRRRALVESQKVAWFLNKKWILLRKKGIKKFEFKLSTGVAYGDEPTYRLIVNTLKDKLMTTKELQEATKINLSTLVQSLILLYSSKMVAIYQKRENNKSIELNKIIARDTIYGESKYIMLPYANTALSLNSIGLIFLDGYYRGIKDKKRLIEYVYQILTDRKLDIMQDNQKIKGEAMKNTLYKMEEKLRESFLSILEETGGVD